MELPDGELVERARDGDIDAFEALVDRHRRVALRVAYAVAGDDAEDAVQDAFVKAYGALGRFRAGSPFRPWVLRIVGNEARNRRRSAGRRSALALRVADPGDARTESPEDAAVASERRRALAAAVASLDDRDREVIALRWFAELSEAEMAAALGVRPGTVKSRLARAMSRLRDVLASEEVTA
jgi:RNA polymerase sigma-70 factor (ECF subfamily)